MISILSLLLIVYHIYHINLLYKHINFLSFNFLHNFFFFKTPWNCVSFLTRRNVCKLNKASNVIIVYSNELVSLGSLLLLANY